jgi:cytochrome P450
MEFRGLSPRDVSEDTMLTVNGRAFELQKGTAIFISTIGVHKDPGIYESPYEYRLKRYEHMHTKTENSDGRVTICFWKNGAPIRHPLLPWGGGHFMVSSASDVING